MQEKDDTDQEKEQEAQQVSQDLMQLLETYLLPLLMMLDTMLDKRLVRTFVQSCVAILRFRNMKQGLYLSELGSYMDNYLGLSKRGPAGTKRIGNLIRSLKWGVKDIDRYILEEADTEVQKLRSQGKRILCLWDGSVLEKPESEKSEGFCPVVSSKAKRVARNIRGIHCNYAPKKAITVMGMEWTAALIAGMEGVPKVAIMRWWTRRGEYARKLREYEEEVLRECVRKWGRLLLYVFDRGYASGPWIQVLQALAVRFVIRWKKGLICIDEHGAEVKVWKRGKGKKYRSQKEIRDMVTGEKMPCDIWWGHVRHVAYASQLSLIRVRIKKEVAYLLTSEIVKTEEQAWTIVFAYRRRWKIELAFRYEKCELGLESPRLWHLENRLKLLSLVTMVYCFLLFLLEPHVHDLIQAALSSACHRTGTWSTTVKTPLYRVRWAISRLWERHRPLLGSWSPPTLQTIRAFACVGRVNANGLLARATLW